MFDNFYFRLVIDILIIIFSGVNITLSDHKVLEVIWWVASTFGTVMLTILIMNRYFI